MTKKKFKMAAVSKEDLEFAKVACGLQAEFCTLLSNRIKTSVAGDEPRSDMAWTVMIMVIEAMFSDDMDAFIGYLKRANKIRAEMRAEN